MKTLSKVGFAIIFVFILTACGDDNNEGSNSNDSETISIPDSEQENTSEEINNESSQDSAENNADLDSLEER